MAQIAQLLPDGPEMEFLDGVAHRKMSPKRRHGRLQAFLTRALEDQGGTIGEAVPEWRCRVGVADGTDTLFVPDVAWASDERLSQLTDADAEEPPFTPEIAIEIRSPGDDVKYLQQKIARYLATGAVLVLDVDPEHRFVTAHTADGTTTYREGDRCTSAVIPWLVLDVTELFTSAERHKQG